jgi:hypothetical protein
MAAQWSAEFESRGGVTQLLRCVTQGDFATPSAAGGARTKCLALLLKLLNEFVVGTFLRLFSVIWLPLASLCVNVITLARLARADGGSGGVKVALVPAHDVPSLLVRLLDAVYATASAADVDSESGDHAEALFSCSRSAIFMC